MATNVIDLATAKKLWIHCNCCYEYFIKRQNILFLLACQHIVCGKCVTASLGRTPADAPTYTCPVCQKKVRGRQINNALPTNLKDMFHPEPWQDGLPHDLIDSFQRANQKHLDDYISKKKKEIHKMEKDMQIAHAVCRKHFLEQHRLRMTRKQLELRARQIHYQAQLQRDQAPQRLARRLKSKSPTFSGNKHIRYRKAPVPPSVVTACGVPLTQTKAKTPQPAAITSFTHHNNVSFIL